MFLRLTAADFRAKRLAPPDWLVSNDDNIAGALDKMLDFYCAAAPVDQIKFVVRWWQEGGDHVFVAETDEQSLRLRIPLNGSDEAIAASITRILRAHGYGVKIDDGEIAITV